MGFKTDAVQKGARIDETFHSVSTPLYLSSTYGFPAIDEPPKFDYTRSGNPTRAALEDCLTALEGGAGATIFATGMAAITTLMFLYRPGDHIVTGHDIYGGTYRLFDTVLRQQGYEFSFVDMGRLEDVRAAMRPNTKLVWIETPSNPLLNLIDIEGVVKVAREKGAETMADNTFLSPYFQRPLDLGVDVVVHSTTKYINGHSDVVGGAVICKTKERAEEVHELTKAVGTACSPFDAYLVLRGVKTLAYRMEGHQANALAVAEFLAGHSAIRRVFYPGLPSHPQHALAKRQMSGFGGMLSLELDMAKVQPKAFAQRLKVFTVAESLGGIQSLICQPWSMTHVSMPEDARRRAGISEAIFRVSVGLEDASDLIADLKQALEG